MKMKIYSENNLLCKIFFSILFSVTILFLVSCTKTIKVYQPPNLDLAQYGRLGIITFSDNAPQSVAQYGTEQFQNQIQSAQTGIPIVELGTKQKILQSIGSDQLDLEAMQKIRQRYKVSAVFVGDINYSDVKTDVKLEDIIDLKANVSSTLDATLSVKLYETEGGAAIWSNSTSWNRKLSKLSIDKNAGVSVGTNGYDDAYKKLIPDMVRDVTHDFRGRYVKQRVDKE
ncbi:hypothetical protein [Kaarinaea lacus]